MLFKGQTDDINLRTVALMWQKLPSLNYVVSGPILSILLAWYFREWGALAGKNASNN